MLSVVFLAACVEPQTFTKLPPDEPVLRVPLNGAYVGSWITGTLRPRLTWEHSKREDAEIYQVQVSADRTFDRLAHDVRLAEPSFTPPYNLEVSVQPPVGRRYYWRVRACKAELCSPYAPERWFELGRSSNDFNGDGYADVLVGNSKLGPGDIRVYLGRPGATFSPVADGLISMGSDAHYFGDSLASAGDFNGDGFADLIVGAAGNRRGESPGDAYLYFGGALNDFLAGPDATLETPEGAVHFADGVTGAGDVNSDGFDDVIVLSPHDDPGLGRAYLYLGGAFGPLIKHDDEMDGDFVTGRFGGSAVAAGDLDGDSVADVLLSRNILAVDKSDKACHSKAFFGAGSGEREELRTWTISSFEDQRSCAMNTGPAGDVNGDGFTDVAIAINYEGDVREVLLKLGGRDPASGKAALLIAPGVGYVADFSALDDVNGDGLPDFGLSTNYHGSTSVFVYLGQKNGEGFALRQVAHLPRASAVANGGDINGDGFSDVVVSYPSVDGVGRAEVYFGATGKNFDLTPDGELLGLDGFRNLNRALPARTY